MAQNVKSVCDVLIANVKSVCDVTIANAKSIVDVDNTGGGGNTPAFSEQVGANAGPTGSDPTTVITLASAVAIGNRVVVEFSWSSAQTLASIADSTGANTYTVHQTQTGTISGVPMTSIIASAHATAGIPAAGTITLTWSSPDFGYRFGRAFEVADVQSSGQPDQSTKASATTNAPTAPASTTATKTAAIGFVMCGNATYTGTWNLIGSADFIDSSFRCNYVQQDFATAGSKDPAGSLNASQTWIMVWAAFK